eukprot:TRINITY_DN10148_c1_g2_i1.p1 TRINITY_DN10148_c1_g2~~TRINITY_DN10148_c1_g2_i1.p1  ORF type:complete len:209 (+),score=33.79 TRINITY_DN10148_c1_g2_i1:112-738(+)
MSDQLFKLMKAVNNGDVEKVQRQLELGVKPADATDKPVVLHQGGKEFRKGTTSLHIAAWCCHADLMQLLLTHTMEVSPEDEARVTPLKVAIETGKNTVNLMTRDSCMKIIRMLLEWGAAFRASDWRGLTIERSNADWEKDNFIQTCPGSECGLKFSLMKRKHHCRGCGKVFCDSCAPESPIEEVRTCSYCNVITKLWKARITLNSDRE